MIDLTQRWYAIYTRSRFEKKVAFQMERLGVEVYLPLERTMQQWSDRKKIIYKPLFSSYVFVRVNRLSYLQPLHAYGALCYVRCAQRNVAIPDCQIEAIRAYLGEQPIDEPLTYFETGDEIEVLYGIMAGLRGKLINTRNHNRLKVQIEAINMNIILTVGSQFLQKVKIPAVKYA